jgi:hypothetical protein
MPALGGSRIRTDVVFDAENDASETEKDLRAWGYEPKTLKLDSAAQKTTSDDASSSGARKEQEQEPDKTEAN